MFALGPSLRRGSYSQAVFRAIKELAPDDVEITTFDIGRLPLFNQDIEAPEFPEPVRDFHAAVADSDAILFVMPEYNYSVPGYLKNAIDWASRPPGKGPIYGKKAGVVSSSPGVLGGARAQYHLRQMGVSLDLRFMNKPEVIITGVNKKFDENLKLQDEPTREFLGKFIGALTDFARS